LRQASRIRVGLRHRRTPPGQANSARYIDRIPPHNFVSVETRVDVVHIARCRGRKLESVMDELNGRMMACQILITGLIARVANNSPDPLRFLTEFRDEIKAVVKGVNIAGMDNTDRVRQFAQLTVDELFSLMKPPSVD
jgi:hypothetical protein